MKSKGTTLLETMVSVMILTIIITIFYNLTFHNNVESQRRKLNEEISRVVFCIMQEIKYNYTVEEVKEFAMGDGLNIAYYEDLLMDLIKKPLTAIEKGNDITMTFQEEAEGNLKIFLNVTVMVQELIINEQRIFVKSKWMEMINEG